MSGVKVATGFFGLAPAAWVVFYCAAPPLFFLPMAAAEAYPPTVEALAMHRHWVIDDYINLNISSF